MPVSGRPPESRSALLRDVSAAATLIALPAAAVANAVGVPGHEWGQMFTFGALFGVAVGLTAPDVKESLRSRLTPVAVLAGLALFLAAPALAYGGTVPVPGELALLGGGSLLLLVAAWRLQEAGPLAFWLGGLLLLAAFGLSLFIDNLPPGTDAPIWVLGGLLALGGAAFLVLRRWLRAMAEERLARGDAAYARRDYEKAIAAYASGISLGRRAGFALPAGWYGKGAALVAAGRFEESIPALDRALVLNPKNEIAWINKGTALTRLGRLNDALKCYNSAIKVNPRYEVAWNNKANALARLGKQDLALACYERAIEIDPEYRTAWVNKGFVLVRLGRFEEAAACADAALRLTTGATAVA